MVLIYIFVFIIATAVGSFVNVVALRYNSGLSFTKGNSRCLSCNTLIPRKHLIPLFSYIWLRGRCAVCKSRFSPIYFLMELFSGIAVTYLFFKFYPFFPSLNLSIFPFLFLTTIYYLLSVIFIYDLRHKIIPDLFVYSFIVFSFVYSVSLNLSIFPSLLASILVPLPFFLIWLFSRGRLLGFGDVKFMVGMGALFGLAQGMSSVFMSFWIGSAYVIILLLIHRKSSNKISMKSEVPFGPFLVLATIISFFFQFNLFNFQM